jgi:hypothetical protein
VVKRSLREPAARGGLRLGGERVNRRRFPGTGFQHHGGPGLLVDQRAGICAHAQERGLFRSPEEKAETKRELWKDLWISLAYILLIVLLIKLGVLKPVQDYFAGD